MREVVPMMQRPLPPAAPWRRHPTPLKTGALRFVVPPARKPFVSLDNITVPGLFRSPTGLGHALDAGYSVSLMDLCDQFKVSGGVSVEITDDSPRPGPSILIVHINGPYTSVTVVLRR